MAAAFRANCNCCGAKVLRWPRRRCAFPTTSFGATREPKFTAGPIAAPPRASTGRVSYFSPALERRNKQACARAKSVSRLRELPVKLQRTGQAKRFQTDDTASIEITHYRDNPKEKNDDAILQRDRISRRQAQTRRKLERFGRCYLGTRAPKPSRA